MAKFIGKVKEEMPHTKSRHSQQAWIQSASGRSDSIMASIEKRRVDQLTMSALLNGLDMKEFYQSTVLGV